MCHIKRSFIFILSLFIGHLSIAQTVLLHESIRDYDFEKPKQGPNFRHFNHLTLGYSLFVPLNDDNEVEIKPGASRVFSVGWRYKYRITNWLSIGSGISYTNEIYNLKQSNNKIIPDTILHSKEKMRFNYINTEGYIRFNIGKRGNIIGRFIDIGAFCGYAFLVEHMYEDNFDNNISSNNAGVERVILSKLNYIERFQYGLKTRIGINRFVLTGNYRLTELLTEDYKKSVGDYYFPQLSVGLEIGLHK